MAKNLVDGTSTTIEENADNISIQINFPIGYIYISTNSTNPSTYFGGQWQRIAKGRTLVGVDENDTDFASAELTGGSKYIQKHQHAVNYSTSVGNTEGRVALGVGSGGEATGSYGYAVNGNMNVSTGQSGNLQPYFTCYIWEKVGA